MLWNRYLELPPFSCQLSPFNETQIIIIFIANFSKQLINFLGENYNYGLLFTVGISQSSSCGTALTYYGNLQNEYHFFLNYGGFDVFVSVAPSQCDDHRRNETLKNIFNDLTDVCTSDNGVETNEVISNSEGHT